MVGRCMPEVVGCAVMVALAMTLQMADHSQTKEAVAKSEVSHMYHSKSET